MNIQITAKPVTSTAALKTHYSAVRRRLFNPAVRPKPAASIEPPKPVAAAPRKILVDCDEHVRMWRRWLASAGSPLKAYITSRCEELGIPYEVMVGPRKTDDIASARRMLMWEIKRKIKPSISFPELGRLFGGRDHTTALHAVHKHDAIMGAPEGVEKRERRRILQAISHQMRSIARDKEYLRRLHQELRELEKKMAAQDGRKRNAARLNGKEA